MWYKKEKTVITFKTKELQKLKWDLEILKNLNSKSDTNTYIWVDIAKDFHYLTLILEKDNKTKKYDLGEIANTTAWFKNLDEILKTLQDNWVKQENVFIWMEATWSYYFSFIQYLDKKSYKNVYVVNAAKIKNFKSASDNSKIKNDKEDSEMISNYLYTYKNILEKDENINSENISKTEQDLVFAQKKDKLIHRTQFLEVSNLRFLYRQLFKEKKELIKIKVRIKELTNKIMPEIYDVFNPNKYSDMELYIKSHFTRDEIIGLSEKEFYKKVMAWTWNRNKNDVRYNNKLKKLQELLKEWIWIDDDDWFLKNQMKLFVDKYIFIINSIENMEKLILMEIENKQLFIPKIYWVSPVLLWVFYSEMGNFLFTKSLKELVWFIWWYPMERSSWWKTLAKPRLQNRWNYMLRHVTYLLIFTLSWHIKEVNEYKNRLKTKKDIKSKQALVESSSKMLRIILSLFKNKQDFDLEKFKELNKL